MVPISIVDSRHWVSRYIDTIHALYPNLDYLIFEGGTNDADVLGNAGLGTLDMSKWSDFDDTNFTGALESLFYKTSNYYPHAKFGFIIAPKMGRNNVFDEENNRRRRFFGRAMEVCKKWGVPFINLWDGNPINPRLDCYYDQTMSGTENIAAGKSYIDGQHPTIYGYDHIVPPIEEWMRSL